MKFLKASRTRKQLSLERVKLSKGAKFSHINTRSIKLIRKYGLKDLLEETIKRLKIRGRKNYSIVAIRLRILRQEMANRFKGLKKEEIATKICDELKSQHSTSIQKKFFEKKKKRTPKNSEKFRIQEQRQFNRMIGAFEKILQTDPKQRKQMREAVEQLIGKHCSQQLQSVEKVTTIFCYTEDEIEKYDESSHYIPEVRQIFGMDEQTEIKKTTNQSSTGAEGNHFEEQKEVSKDQNIDNEQEIESLVDPDSIENFCRPKNDDVNFEQLLDF